MSLLDHRRREGLTLAALAEKLGLSRKSVGWLSEIETGKRDASLRLALRIERWSGGAVPAASVNSEIRSSLITEGREPGLHGVSPSVDDAATLAPAESRGAEKNERNFSRTGVTA